VALLQRLWLLTKFHNEASWPSCAQHRRQAERVRHGKGALCDKTARQRFVTWACCSSRGSPPAPRSSRASRATSATSGESWPTSTTLGQRRSAFYLEVLPISDDLFTITGDLSFHREVARLPCDDVERTAVSRRATSSVTSRSSLQGGAAPRLASLRRIPRGASLAAQLSRRISEAVDAESIAAITNLVHRVGSSGARAAHADGEKYIPAGQLLSCLATSPQARLTASSSNSIRPGTSGLSHRICGVNLIDKLISVVGRWHAYPCSAWCSCR